MTISSRFFESATYYQPDFAKMIKDTIRDGYVQGLGTECKVVATSPLSMHVLVGVGRLYVQGYSLDVETSPYNLTLPDSDVTNPRIDRIVARLSITTDKSVTLAVLEGVPSSSPVPPTLTQSGDTYEMSLAQVYIGAGVGSVTNGNITDERILSGNNTYVNHATNHANNGADRVTIDASQIVSGTIQTARLPIATPSVIGAVKIGSGLSVSSDGTVSLNVTSGAAHYVTYSTSQSSITLGTCTMSGQRSTSITCSANVQTNYSIAGTTLSASSRTQNTRGITCMALADSTITPIICRCTGVTGTLTGTVTVTDTTTGEVIYTGTISRTGNGDVFQCSGISGHTFSVSGTIKNTASETITVKLGLTGTQTFYL